MWRVADRRISYEFISEELRERRFAPVVRLEVASTMPEHVRTLLMSEPKWKRPMCNRWMGCSTC